MGNKMQLLRGDARIIALPKCVSEQITMGDLLWWDATAGTYGVRNATKAGSAANFATKFVGVAMSSLDAGVSGDVLVATDGDFEFACTATAAEVGGGVAVVVSDQTVAATATAGEIIGRVLSPKPSGATRVEVRVLPILNK